jgi:hypothetical protein
MEKQHNRGDGAGFASIKLDVEQVNDTYRVRSKCNLFRMFSNKWIELMKK